MSLRRSFLNIILMLVFASSCAQAQDVGLTTLIDDYLSNYAQSVESANNLRISYTIGNIDPRLSIKSCSQPLSFEFASDPTHHKTSTLKVRCEDSKPWRLFTQVSFRVFKKIWISRHPIARGQKLMEKDLAAEEIETTNLRPGYIEVSTPLHGYQAARTIKSGSPIYFRQIKPSNAIEKGDKVLISAQSGLIHIQTAGTALGSGKIGDQIAIRNQHSQRIVKAIVIKKGKVEIPL